MESFRKQEDASANREGVVRVVSESGRHRRSRNIECHTEKKSESSHTGLQVVGTKASFGYIYMIAYIGQKVKHARKMPRIR